MPPNEAQVLDALRTVTDPELRRNLVDLGLVRDLRVRRGRVSLTVAMVVPDHPRRAEILGEVRAALGSMDGVEELSVDETVLTEEEQAALRQTLIGDPAATAGSSPAH